VPDVIVNVFPLFEQPPALEKLTTPPGACAATPNDELNAADPGACVSTVIVWFAFCAVTVSTTCGAGLNVASPGWSYRTEHAVVPDVIVNVAPEFEHPPADEYVTGPPGAVAATVNCVPNTALPGACVFTVIVWSSFAELVVSVTCGAAL